MINSPVNSKHTDDECRDFYSPANAKVQKLVAVQLWCGKQNSKVTQAIGEPVNRQYKLYHSNSIK